MKPSLTVPLAIIVGSIVVAGAIYFSIRKPTVTPNGGNPALVRPVTSSDHILGNPTARVMIVEYSDFDCGFCQEFHETMNQIIANEGARGDVAWVFRHFPLSEIHPNAMSNSRAAECAAQNADNDAFWKFIDELFANQPINPSNYGEFAVKAGIKGNAFATCFANASTTLDARITSDRKNAIAVGAEGTPYSLILVEGKAPVIMNGAYPYDAVKILIDQALGN